MLWTRKLSSNFCSFLPPVEFEAAQHKATEKNWTPEEIIKYAYKHKPYFSPGMGWHYTNGAYNILGLLIEKITKNGRFVCVY